MIEVIFKKSTSEGNQKLVQFFKMNMEKILRGTSMRFKFTVADDDLRKQLKTKFKVTSLPTMFIENRYICSSDAIIAKIQEIMSKQVLKNISANDEDNIIDSFQKDYLYNGVERTQDGDKVTISINDNQREDEDENDKDAISRRNAKRWKEMEDARQKNGMYSKIGAANDVDNFKPTKNNNGNNHGNHGGGNERTDNIDRLMQKADPHYINQTMAGTGDDGAKDDMMVAAMLDRLGDGGF